MTYILKTPFVSITGFLCTKGVNNLNKKRVETEVTSEVTDHGEEYSGIDEDMAEEENKDDTKNIDYEEFVHQNMEEYEDDTKKKDTYKKSHKKSYKDIN